MMLGAFGVGYVSSISFNISSSGLSSTTITLSSSLDITDRLYFSYSGHITYRQCYQSIKLNSINMILILILILILI